MAYEHEMSLDTSSMEQVLSIAKEILSVSKDLNQQRTKLKVDYSEVGKAKSEYDKLVNDIEHSEKTQAQLFDTKAVQSTIDKITKQMDTLYNKLQKEGSTLTPFQTESFIKGFKTLEAYSDRFGKNLTSKYQDIFNTVTSQMDEFGGFKRLEVNAKQFTSIVENAIKDASDTLMYDLYDANKQATDKMLANAKSAYKEEVALAKQAAEQESEIEKQKYEAMQNMRDQLVSALKAVYSIAGDGDVFKFDLSEFANVQQMIYEIIRLLSDMGVETEKIEDIFSSLTNKVYIPTDQLENAKNAVGQTTERIEKLEDEISRLSVLLEQSVDIKDFEKLQQELEIIEDELKTAREEAEHYRDLWMSAPSNRSFDSLAAETFEYKTALEKTNEELALLKEKYNELVKSGSSKGDTLSQTFSIDKADDFLEVLNQISGHLTEIKKALGTVDDNNGFTNIISSVDILLGKLDEMYQKIGTGINNITVNKTSEIGSSGEIIVSGERDRLLRSYNRVVKSFGGESNAFSSMAQLLPSNYGENLTEQFNTLYSSNSINKITNMTEQINRLRSFFGKINEYKNELASQLELQAKIVKGLEADLNRNPLDTDVFDALSSAKVIQSNLQYDYDKISKIRIPSSENTALNKKLDELNQKEFDIAELQDDKIDLSEITEKLTEIRDLILDISQRNLFGDSIDEAISRMDTLISKFDAIVADVNILNETPISVTNRTDRHGMDVIKHTGTGEEISQQAYDVLYKLEKGVDVSVEELTTIPEVVEGYRKLDQTTNEFRQQYSYLGQTLKDTSSLHTEERDALRDYIVGLRKESGSFSGKDKDGNDLYTGEVGNDYKATIVMGLPASGKSSSLVNPLSEYYKAKVIDSDMIKELLPEFNNGWGASLVHEESSELNMRYLKETIFDEVNEGANVIIPIVGSTVEKVLEYVNLLTEAGYDVDVALNEIPNNETSARNLKRYFSDNRFLEPGFVRKYGDKPTQVYEELQGNENIRGFLRYDNMVDRGQRPRLVGSSGYDANLEKYLANYKSSKNENDKSNTKDLQEQIQYFNELIKKRQELAELQKQYTSDNAEFGDISKQISDIDSELMEKFDVSLSEPIEEIKTEGEVAEEAAQKKRDFAEANNIDVVQSAKNTASTVPEATEAIEAEAEAVGELNKATYSTDDSVNATNDWVSSLEDAESQLESNVEAIQEAIEASKKLDGGSAVELLEEAGEADRYLTNTENWVRYLENAEENLVEINGELQKQSNFGNDDADASALEMMSENQTEIIAQNEAIENNLRQRITLINQINSLETSINKYKSQGVSEDDARITSRSELIAKLREQLQVLEELELTETQLARVSSETEKTAKALEDSRAQAAQKAQKDAEAYEKKIASLKKTLSSMMNNGKLMAAYGDEIKALFNQLENSSSLLPGQLDEIAAKIKNIQIEANKTGNTGKTFFQQLGTRFQSLATYLASFASFYDIIRYIRQAYTNVQELNTQMIELAKVSEQTFTQIKGDFSSYAEVAKDLGATISDTISATSDWSRMGYNIPDSKELARVALLYKNVGDGIDITSANESLISTLQGYQMTADESEHIIDVFNEVANNYAIDTAGIGEALQRSAASLNAANTSLEQSVALVTAANTVVQNPESVGTTFKTLSARIRGATTELADLGEEEDEFTQTTSKLQNLVKGLTGFDILEEDQKTFKSIYDILIGIGDAWKDLDDIERASLGEALAGKRNANTLYAVLDNIDTLKSAYETAENSAGSAMREQENYEQGLEYSTNRMKAALEELSADFLRMDFLKNLVDTGTSAIEIIDKLISEFGVLKTAIVAIGTVWGSQKLG